jgi:hypothetical protein
MSLQTPRILPSHLHAFHPSGGSSNTVRILGTVTALHGSTGTLTCGSNGNVTLILKSDARLQVGKLVEVVGKVADLEGGQVCTTSVPAGFSLDIGNFNFVGYVQWRLMLCV